MEWSDSTKVNINERLQNHQDRSGGKEFIRKSHWKLAAHWIHDYSTTKFSQYQLRLWNMCAIFPFSLSVSSHTIAFYAWFREHFNSIYIDKRHASFHSSSCFFSAFSLHFLFAFTFRFRSFHSSTFSGTERSFHCIDSYNVHEMSVQHRWKMLRLKNLITAH